MENPEGEKSFEEQKAAAKFAIEQNVPEGGLRDHLLSEAEKYEKPRELTPEEEKESQKRWEATKLILDKARENNNWTLFTEAMKQVDEDTAIYPTPEGKERLRELKEEINREPAKSALDKSEKENWEAMETLLEKTRKKK